jgi:SAM-dependent methyltransferase
LETAALAPLIRRFHGDSILWIGGHGVSANALQRCMVRNAFFLQPEYLQPELSQHDVTPATRNAGGCDLPSLASQTDALPFKSNSLDGIVLHHALETAPDPRIVLREVTRVLAPGGRVVICGFNPLSIIGLRRLYARVVNQPLSSRRLINPIRLFDWLTLLGFELEGKPHYCGYMLPFKRLMQKIDVPLLEGHDTEPSARPTIPFGSLLIVNAVKQAITRRPQPRLRKERRRLAPVAYPRVASWQRIRP